MEGLNEDFVVPDTIHSLFGMNPDPFSVPVSLRLDNIALEPHEDFLLSLVGDNPTAMIMLAGGTSGLFFSLEIRVVIQDFEGKKCL